MNIMTRISQKIYRDLYKLYSSTKMKTLGIIFYPPNYIYFDNLNKSSIVIDVGCGHEAEFSRHLIGKHNLQVYGVDPTKKHSPYLKKIEEDTNGNFHHLSLAVTSNNGFITFHESRQNESGSILLEHTNIQQDDTITYNVESVNLQELVNRVGTTPIDFIKLDLEGAEYELLNDISEEDISPFRQIFIEFHHHCTNHTIQETMSISKNICRKGFKAFTLEHHNYLFYK